MINGLVIYEYREKTDHPCEITANGDNIKKSILMKFEILIIYLLIWLIIMTKLIQQYSNNFKISILNFKLNQF
jgi:hypothetical protein